MGIQKFPLLKTYQMPARRESINVYRQFEWLEILLVYYKSNKHLTIYNSYNVELASKTFLSVSLENFTEACSLTNQKI